MKAENALSKQRTLFGPRSYKAAWAILCFFVITGLFAPLLCNEHAVLGKTSDGRWIFPWTNLGLQSHSPDNQTYISPLIPYSNSTIDKNHLGWKAPGAVKKDQGTHWLGTSKLGKDVLAGMIYGCQTALFIGIFSVTIAFSLGTCFGLFAGYFQDNRLKINGFQAIIYTLTVPFFLYYLFYGLIQLHFLSICIALGILGIMLWLSQKAGKIGIKKLRIPVDTLLSKLMEIRKSIPLLYLLLAATAIVHKQSIWLMSIIIGFSVWVPFARHSRAGTLSLINEGYVQAAQAVGLNNFKVMTKHILKALLPQLLVVSAFAMSSSILLESTLSFLGMGMPIEGLTWGSMLAEAKQNPSAWWMAIFPGLGIFFTVLSCNIIGEKWSTPR